MALKIYIKQAIQYNIQGQPIVYLGTNPYNLQATPNGTLPNNRRWQPYNTYIDVTGDVSDLTQLSLTWTVERDVEGLTVPGAFNNKKSASGTLTFENNAYMLIKSWLINDVSAPLNAVSVKIVDDCGTYDDYQFKAEDLRWCEEGDNSNVCTFDLTLKQVETPIQCIKRTEIYDNHLGWFQTVPANGKKHPRFSYCTEIRPNGMLVAVWWMAGIQNVVLLTLIPLLFALNGIFAIINVIIGVIATIIAIVGGNPISSVNWQTIPYFDFKGMLDAIGQYYIEAAGCGREHPAPLIRDYIYNVCKKCGLDTDDLALTVPLFFSPSITMHSSSRGIIELGENPYYRACYLFPQAQRGIRRFKNLDLLYGSTPNNTDFWIPGNAPVRSLTDLLDELKGVFNCEWNVVGNKLYFQRKDFFLDGNYVLDFTATAQDRLKLLQGICFEFDETKYPATCTGIYALDGADVCGNEACSQMNGTVSFGLTDNNPNFEGTLDKTTRFGATKFRLDGASTDYIFDAMQVVVNGSLFSPFSAGIMRDIVAEYLEDFCDFALLLKQETTTLPKILIWDGVDYTNAKAVRKIAAHIGANLPLPIPNPVYNKGTQVSMPVTGQQLVATSWYDLHVPETFVIGSKVTFGNQPAYKYRVEDYFGILVTEQPAMLINYPMYFEPRFYDTLWDWFHWIDDPERNPRIRYNWTAIMDNCCDTLNTLGVFAGQDIALNQKVKLPLQYYPDGRITEITVNYRDDELGSNVTIKGTV